MKVRCALAVPFAETAVFALSALLFGLPVTVAEAQLSCGTASAAAVTNPTPDAIVQLVAVGPAGTMGNRSCAATGFLINEDGYRITHAHVVEDAQRCLHNAPGAKILAEPAPQDSQVAPAVPCDLIGVDLANDLAILKTARPLLTDTRRAAPYMLLDTHDVPAGTPVSVTGYPTFSWQPVTQSGSIVWTGKQALGETDSSPASARDALRIDIHLQPGNSGSPVYREGGRVIAIVHMRDPLRPADSIAVAIHYATALADRYQVTWHSAD